MNPQPISDIYEKFKHLDIVLGDTEWCSKENAAIYGVAGELWRAVKEAMEEHIPLCKYCQLEPTTCGSSPESCEELCITDAVRSRPHLISPLTHTLPEPFIKYTVEQSSFDCIKIRKLAFNDIGDESDDFSRLNLPPIKDGDIICVYRGNVPLTQDTTDCPHHCSVFRNGFDNNAPMEHHCDFLNNTCEVEEEKIRQDEREKVLDEMRLNCFGKYQMNNSRCLICQIGEKCYDKRESLRKKDGE